MVIKKNSPSLWITINPSNIHDPVVQVLTGAEIDLDRFSSTAGLDNHQCAI
ncbi:hypothetical protein J3R82DRAFT_9690 [Butyriboletus roseoflavus]|nr:hypothetical protein J3R82DRAFT_9690 [Butyriboletus roseoflavus]